MSVVSTQGAIGVYDLTINQSAVLDEVLVGKQVTVAEHGWPGAGI